MSYKATVLADSVTASGHRLTSFEARFPRLILPEFNTHRLFSRNSASSRAIPVIKLLRALLEGPFEPARFGINQPGMQALSFLTGVQDEEARRIWRQGRDRAMFTALQLLLGERRAEDLFVPSKLRAKLEAALEGELKGFALGVQPNFDDPDARGRLLDGLRSFEVALKNDPASAREQYLNAHKQLANRVLEPYMWHTVIVTATEWDNFFALRAHPDAQPEIQTVARMMQDAYKASQPRLLGPDEWHMPLLQDFERAEAAADPDRWLRVVIGRCARVSYLTHDGVRDPGKDLELFERLTSSGHMSPLEHVARPLNEEERQQSEWSGNFRGWKQYRKLVPNEENYAKVLALSANN